MSNKSNQKISFSFCLSVGFIISIIRKFKTNVMENSRLPQSEINRVSFGSDVYKLLYENNGDALMLSKPNGNIYLANPAACAMFQFSEKEIISLGRSGLVDQTDPRLPIALEIRKTTGKFTGELNFIRKDGTVFSGEVTSVIFYDEKGEEHTCLSIRDISERMKVENDLKVSEEKYRTLFENSQVGKFRLEVNAEKLIDVNEKLCQIFGYTKSEMINTAFFEKFSDPNCRDKILKLIRKKYFINQSECEIVRKNGEKRILISNSVYSPETDVLQASMIDITDRKLMEAELLKTSVELKRKNELFDSLFSTLPIGVFMVEAPTGKPLLSNERALNLLGRGVLPDANKQNLSDVYKAFKGDLNTPYPVDEMSIVKGMYGESSHTDDMLVQRPDGTVTHLEIFGSPVKNEKGEVWASLVSFIDIKERKQLEMELIHSKEMLKRFATFLQNNQEQERILLATKLDNELGQILVAMKIQIGMLKNKLLRLNPDEESMRLLQKLDEIHASTSHSIKTITEFMNDLRFEVLHLMGFVEAVTLFSSDFERKNKLKCTFISNVTKLEIDENDATSLFRILQIALDNVARHAFATEVTISLIKSEQKLTLEISDNGTGFNLNQTYLPTANGLIFMQERALLLNGTFTIKSEIGKGTTVKVKVPV